MLREPDGRAREPAVRSDEVRSKVLSGNGSASGTKSRPGASTYRAGRSQRDWAGPWGGYCDDGNPVTGCLDPAAHRRRGGTWPRLPTTVEWGCIPAMPK